MKPKCPKCGGDLVKGGNASGVQRWRHNNHHRDKNVCQWNGTRPVMPIEASPLDQKAMRRRHKAIVSKRGVKRYVITAAQNATPVHKAFLETLQYYCRVNRAELIVIPYRYKNPTSIWSDRAKDDDWWAPEIVPYILERRIELNKNLVVLGDIKTQPTATSPLQGFETMTGSRSGVIGHPKLELTSIATPQAKLPKLMTTTGACTMPNYLPGKAGKKGEFHHTFGACVIEVDGDVFYPRQINALKDGSFHELEYAYSGTTRKRVSVLAVALGDEHTEFLDQQASGAVYGRGGMIDVLRPKYVVHHDVHDFYARNHHHKHEPFINFGKHHFGMHNVERALDETFATIDKNTRSWVTNVFVPSNHPDALARWVKECDPKQDPENAVFWARTFTAMLDGVKRTAGGVSTIDPFRYWAERKLKTAKQAVFLARDESFMLCGVELGYHGDKGANGARGSRAAYGKIGVKTIVGHSHSPGIKDGCYQVGTLAHLRLEYNSGPSSWLHTNCLLYANGKRCLVNIIDGRWRA